MEKEKTQISLTLAENESVIRTWCENCDDIQIRPMKLGKTGGTGALLIYVEVAVSCVMLKDSVIGKLLNRLMEVPEADIPGFSRKISSEFRTRWNLTPSRMPLPRCWRETPFSLWTVTTAPSKSVRRDIQIWESRKPSPRKCCAAQTRAFPIPSKPTQHSSASVCDHRSESGGDTFWCAF